MTHCHWHCRHAAAKVGAEAEYDDYREMLRVEKPSLVVIATRWSEEHYDMAMACIEAGAHIFMEKPFVHSPAQADRLVAAARAKKLAFVVKHEMHLAPTTGFVAELIRSGKIGKLLQIDAYGKMDRRAGAEDMVNASSACVCERDREREGGKERAAA
eukprot:SAG22_NODE_1970_length_3231_cov_4.101533_5_plen_157_part_00